MRSTESKLSTLLAFLLSSLFALTAAAAEQRLPTYFPNTETLDPDEMRITALGTGLPTPLTRAQKSTTWMVELGNGDVFLFDLGTGSMTNLFGLRPDFSKMDKVFLSHLHSDHFGDLDAFIVGSWLSGRYTPLHVYGGSGETPEVLAAFNDWEMRPSTFVTSYIHTPPEGFGKVMSAVKPRMAVAFHTVLLPDIHQGMLEGIRKTYDGPLNIATDLMVWNVTKDEITMRTAAFPDRVTPPSTTRAYHTAPRSGEAKMSDYVMSGVWKGFTPPPLPKE